MIPTRTAHAVELMARFAERTGLTSDRPPRRYLWTDAFAVCTFIRLERATADREYLQIALRLVHQVHHELGRHRKDDPRTGWISGLPDTDAEAHPTRGGLRIGKALPERGADEPLDPQLEWERDGQYFHYLTRWAHALDVLARHASRPTFHVWARELMDTAHQAFACGPPDGRRMIWKLSIDRSRPLVPSMGQHDPLDGLVMCRQLDATAATLGVPADPDLSSAASDFSAMLDPRGLATIDPLGLGGLLVDACRLDQFAPGAEQIGWLLRAAADGLRVYVASGEFEAGADRRLAFRELGLSMGLAGVSRLLDRGAAPRKSQSAAALTELAGYLPLREAIESFWLMPRHRQVRTWVEHEDINDVMLAASVIPDGFLALDDGPPRQVG